MYQEKSPLENLPAEITEAEKLRSILRHIARLSNIDSYSEKENKVREYLINQAKRLNIPYQIDDIGNVWFKPTDKKTEQKKILFCAHMDKVGPGTPLKDIGDMVEGRLDNAFGMGLILSLYEKGYRPTTVFTVQEEAEVHFQGKMKIRKTDLEKPPTKRQRDFSLGARRALVDIYEGKHDKPYLVVNVDGSGLGQFKGIKKYENVLKRTYPVKPGMGIISYVSHDNYHLLNAPLKIFQILAKRHNIPVIYKHGVSNDALEFSFSGLHVLNILIAIENIHTEKEKISKKDLLIARKALKLILRNAEVFEHNINETQDDPGAYPTHYQWTRNATEIPDKENPEKPGGTFKDPFADE
jgi:hypothetical protein